MLDKVTVCITMGSRPDLLVQTLKSIPNIIQNCRVLAVNDFGDTETNEAFKQVCPHGELIDLNGKSGHHAVMDEMYKHVETDYVFHMEDDWQFKHEDFVEQSIALLSAQQDISIVCFRAISNFPFSKGLLSDLEATEIKQNKGYYDLTHLHDQWHGYTFNPHMARLDLWRKMGGFSQFKKERYVSRAARQLGYKVAYLKSGPCVHIGDGFTTNGPTFGSRLKDLRTKIRSFFRP